MRKQFADIVKTFARDESGASMVEYSVLVGLITAALIAAVAALGDQIILAFEAITQVLVDNQAGR
jgi:pilus assembly protein Flp/PilA